MDETTKDTLCEVCQKIDIREYLFGETNLVISLGGFQEILSKNRCPLCRLLIRALSQNSNDDTWEVGRYPTEQCYLGQRSGPFDAPLTEVWFNSTTETLPKGRYGHSTIRGEILPVSGRTQIQQRKSARDVSSIIDYSLLRGWLATCEEEHGETCLISRVETSATTPSTIILIDVEEKRLVDKTLDCRYLAMSYVWGNVRKLQLRKNNAMELRKEGSLALVETQIPRAIRDAMDIVNNLREKYLWVDSLCIVQDDLEEKLHHISQMGEIYSRALLTIAIVAGNDANTDLPGVRPETRSKSSEIEVVKGLQLVPKLPDLVCCLEWSKWESRAWTFQERILSSRVLYISDFQVYFHCRGSSSCEQVNGIDCGSTYIGSGPTNALDFPVRDDMTLEHDHVFAIYESLVKSYTHRQMSYHSDSLYAFRGILSTLERRFGWKFMSAIPESMLDLALLWVPMASVRRRPLHLNKSSSVSMKLPSWCWTSWIGDIYWDPWRLQSYCRNDIRLESEIEIVHAQDGVLSNNGYSTLDFSKTQELGTPVQVLYFMAYTAGLDKFSISIGRCTFRAPLSSWQKSIFLEEGMIFDFEGHHCGSLRGLDQSWSQRPDISNCELLLLSYSQQKVVTDVDVQGCIDKLPAEYPLASDYYDQRFDARYYTPTERWAMNVMLVEWIDGFAYRLAVGQLHCDAWKMENQCKKLIKLA